MHDLKVNRKNIKHKHTYVNLVSQDINHYLGRVQELHQKLN